MVLNITRANEHKTSHLMSGMVQFLKLLYALPQTITQLLLSL